MNWNIQYSLIIVFITLINYFSALVIEKTTKKQNKKYTLIFSVTASLLVLVLFKYYNFTIHSLEYIFSSYGFEFKSYYINILLPVGISFYIFQTIGYLLDVYWGKIKAEKNLFIFALYVSFFPQLVAGPIERAKNLLPQFKENKHFSKKNFLYGIHFILWGLFLKTVIADGLSEMVDFIYNSPETFESGLTFLVGTYMFAFQIFGDFAGYTFIAIGVAKILGYDLMKNFNRPYFAKSIGDFWRRWHISLSTWFKDYIYIPLGGSKQGLTKNIRNLLIVFIVSGVWHGANLTFIIWGLIHGFIISIEVLSKKLLSFINVPNKLGFNLIKIFITFHLVIITWIFFRANTLSDALYILETILDFQSYTIEGVFFDRFLYLSILMFGWIIILEIIHYYNERGVFFLKIFEKFHICLKLFIYSFFTFLILIFGNFNQRDFIYFQF